MTQEEQTKVRWFGWFAWFTDKLEAWLEAQAAAGWHLVKADWLLMRFHFRQGAPKKVRYCVDFPANVTSEYELIFQDAGWEHVLASHGWHIWRAEYSGERRPEAFNDPDPLIERNGRLLVMLVGTSAALLALFPFLLLQGFRPSLAGPGGKALLAAYVVVIVALVMFIGAAFGHYQRLKERKQ